MSTSETEFKHIPKLQNCLLQFVVKRLQKVWWHNLPPRTEWSKTFPSSDKIPTINGRCNTFKMPSCPPFQQTITCRGGQRCWVPIAVMSNSGGDRTTPLHPHLRLHQMGKLGRSGKLWWNVELKRVIPTLMPCAWTNDNNLEFFTFLNRL